MSWREFRLRMVRAQRDPIHRRRGDWQFASVCQQIARIAAILTESKTPSLPDLTLLFSREEIEERRLKRMHQEIQSLAIAHQVQREVEAGQVAQVAQAAKIPTAAPPAAVPSEG